VRPATGALFNTEDVLAVDGAMIESLKASAETSPTRRFRLCLHRSTDEPVQEMVVVHCRDNYSRPHAHGAPLTYLVLEGRLRVLLFDDGGKVTRAIDLLPFGAGGDFVLRIEAGRWYMPVCLTPQVIFYERKTGVFRRDESNLWAPWSPAEDDASGIAAFRDRLGVPRD